MVWLIVLLCLVLFLMLPLKLHAHYNRQAVAYLRFGPVKVMLYPSGSKKKVKSAGDKSESFESHEQVKKKKRTDREDVISIVKLVLDFLDDFRTKLRVDNLQLRIVLADEDPCDLSIRYGRSWLAVGSLYPQLERYFIIKNRFVEVQCDYTADKTVVDASVDISITVGRILTIGAYHGTKLLRKYFKMMKKSKDGAVL